MHLVSIYESGKSLNFQTVENLNDLYRGLCAGLDLNKFNSYSNFNLFCCRFNIPDKIDDLLSDMNNDDNRFYSCLLYEPFNDNLADSVYDYMVNNINMYYDIVKEIDSFREKITSYKVDKN